MGFATCPDPGVTTGLHRIEWLLVTLITLCVAVMGIPDEGGGGLLMATMAYFGFSLTASRLRFFDDRQRWLLAIHTWVMIGFITWFLYSTEGVTGPLASLYLLFQLGGATLMTPANLALIGTNLVVFLIVGYLTSELVNAIQVSNRMLLAMASQDSLTGLLNRRAFDDLARQIHATAQRSRRTYSVIAIDMDGLKTLNDTWGHEAGDRAILDLAQRLKGAVRSSDLVARYGGDEFVMLLPDTDADGARQLMQRLLAYVAGSELQFSIGVSSYPEHGQQLVASSWRACWCMPIGPCMRARRRVAIASPSRVRFISRGRRSGNTAETAPPGRHISRAAL